jgi:CHAT domain
VSVTHNTQVWPDGSGGVGQGDRGGSLQGAVEARRGFRKAIQASEVAQLKLNADWVVLSACNTIAGDKPEAEALSGLARSFFYAGARAFWFRIGRSLRKRRAD